MNGITWSISSACRKQFVIYAENIPIWKLILTTFPSILPNIHHLLAEVHLDYFGRTYRRSIELFCKDGSCVADFGAGTLTLPTVRWNTMRRTSTSATCAR